MSFQQVIELEKDVVGTLTFVVKSDRSGKPGDPILAHLKWGPSLGTEPLNLQVCPDSG